MRRRWGWILILLLVGLSAAAVANPDIRLPSPGEGDFVRKGFTLGLDISGGTHLVLEADLSQLSPGESAEDAMKGAEDIIQRRINAYGVAEPIIQRAGSDRIVVQLPGVKNVSEAVRLIGKTALLDFREPKLDETGNIVHDDKGNIAEWLPAKGVVDGEEVQLTGKYLKRQNRVMLHPQSNEPEVAFEWEEKGARLFEQITARLLEKPLGIFLDEELISAPRVRAVIKESGVITGLTLKEAELLAIQLNAGALPVPLKPIQQKDVDATLGSDSLHKSLLAGILGFVLVLLFMLLYYRFPGFVSGIALICYGLIALAIFKLLPVTLTLAGIAGFIVSLGMAVDANVLIFERMKEELRRGRTLGAAVDTGFSRAWTAIRDSNITTFIACAILYWFGSKMGAPQVMGFAVTLFIGVAVSMFTAITVTHHLLRLALVTPVAKMISLFKV